MVIVIGLRNMKLKYLRTCMVPCPFKNCKLLSDHNKKDNHNRFLGEELGWGFQPMYSIDLIIVS